MNICDICGKDFIYPSKLIRHLHRKIKCSPIEENYSNNQNVNVLTQNVNFKNQNVNCKNQNVNGVLQNVNDFSHNVNVKRFYICYKCDKELSSENSLKRHLKNCQGCKSLQCHICSKVFTTRQGKSQHLKNVQCKPILRNIDYSILQKENEKLKKEIELLKSTKNTTTINNTKNTINYNIIYNPDTKSLTTNDPNAPCQELLCFNGFKLEASKADIKDIDILKLQVHIDNIRNNKDFLSFYNFFFRSMDNPRLQMFILGKNNNATHAQVFNNGNIEKMDKSQLFDNVSKYIGQYLLNVSTDNIDVINILINDQRSKSAFVEVLKDNSGIFDYYKNIVFV